MYKIQFSVKNEHQLCIQLLDFDHEVSYMNIDVVEIKKAHNEFLMSVGGPIYSEEKSCFSMIDINTNYPDMLCSINRITISSLINGREDAEKTTIKMIKGKDFDNLFFKISESKLLIYEGIERDVNSILTERQKRFYEPIGDIGNDKAHDYSLFVFLSNCLLPGGDFVLDKCQVMTHENLGALDIVESVKRFINSKAHINVDFSDIYSISQKISMDKPTTVLYFPSIKASNPDSIFQYVIERIDNITYLLSYRRMSKVDVYGYFVYDKIDNTGGLIIPKELYSGNLLPDFISESSYLATAEPKVAGNKFIQLILKLYKYALAEKRADFIYFSFWNILESVARYQGYDVAKNSDGTIKLNKKRDRINLGASDMVRELITEIYNDRGMNPQFTANSKNYSVLDMTIMWCQHRNCTAHKGGCNPDDLLQCDTNNINKVKCKSNTVGIPPSEAEIYLRTIKRLTNDIITKIIY